MDEQEKLPENGSMKMEHLILIFALSCSAGCCWMAKRDCFPPCPPPQLVKVEQPCSLPDPLVLEPFTRDECPGQPNMVCFSVSSAAKLAGNLEAMKTWIQRAEQRCGGLPTSLPTAQPTNR